MYVCFRWREKCLLTMTLLDPQTLHLLTCLLALQGNHSHGYSSSALSIASLVSRNSERALQPEAMCFREYLSAFQAPKLP